MEIHRSGNDVMKSTKPRDQFVYPGEKLAVIEEFLEGEGTYQQNGIVRSTELGQVQLDLNKRKVGVTKKTRELLLPKEGLDVYGEVGSVMRRDANVDVFMIGGKMLSEAYTGVIQATDGGRNLEMDLRSGDIVRARIINTKNRVLQLSIDGADYGVIYAHCSRCGTILDNRQTQLVCPKCGRVERRKTARNYGADELR